VNVNFRGFIDGRPDFDEYPETETVISADLVIFAIGQRPDSDCLKQAARQLGGRVQVEAHTLATDVPGVFPAVTPSPGLLYRKRHRRRPQSRPIDRCIPAGREFVAPPERHVAKMPAEEVAWRIAAHPEIDRPAQICQAASL
jgi:hypothetical protein